jgi:hypothetical protein
MCAQNKISSFKLYIHIAPCIYSWTIKIMQIKNNTVCPNIMCAGMHIKMSCTVQILCILRGKIYIDLNT